MTGYTIEVGVADASREDASAGTDGGEAGNVGGDIEHFIIVGEYVEDGNARYDRGRRCSLV